MVRGKAREIIINMQNQSLATGSSSDQINQEMGFVAAEKKEEKLAINTTKGSLLLGQGGSWWWQNVKPFVNGGSAKLLAELQSLGGYNTKYHKEHAARVAKLHHHHENMKWRAVRLPLEAIVNAIAFGSFEILTRKAMAVNHGTPLRIHQEVCCAVLSGTVGACIGSPLFAAFYLAETMKPEATKVAYGNAFKALYNIGANKGLSALWNPGVFWFLAALYTGMLAPYNRNHNYFKDSCGLSKFRAQMSAGAVSAFFASACCIRVCNVRLHMQAMRPNADGKFPFTSPLDCGLKVLKSRGLAELWHFTSYHVDMDDVTRYPRF